MYFGGKNLALIIKGPVLSILNTWNGIYKICFVVKAI